MTREQHNILYNIEVTAFCDNNQGLHLCPREKDYRYFVYWSEALSNEKNQFGSLVGGNKIQIKRGTGEEVVSLKEPVALCARNKREQRVEMIHSVACKDEDYIQEINQFGELLEQAIGAVAIEKTLVLMENRGWKDLPLIDFTDVLNRDVLLIHFKSLFQCYVREQAMRKDGLLILQRMIQLLNNWEKIYSARADIMNQVERYVNLIAQGIEEKRAASPDLTYYVWEIKKKISIKREARDFLSFILPEESNREQFQKNITVLKAYLEAIGEKSETILNLLTYLRKYEIADLQIDKIKKLKKFDFSSNKARIANANLIDGYLADEVKNSGLKLIELIV